MVAPIALYPDPLVAQILAAATYPLEVVEADRWLQANPGLKGTALTDAARNQPWDPSVQALVVFPSVLGMLDRNLTWTVNLGNAFLAQPQDVMDAIQRQRQRALSSGALTSNQQQLVQQTTDAIEIVPAQPEVIYVPVYDPVLIWGPPVFHPWPLFWYPPRPVDAVIAAGFVGFFFSVGIASSFHYWGGWPVWGWGVGWHEHTVVVNNNFHARNNYRLPNNYIRSGPSAWSHDPAHRGGLAYPSRGVAGRVGAPAARIPPPAPRPGGEGMVITRPPRFEPRPAPSVRSGPAPGAAAPRARRPERRPRGHRSRHRFRRTATARCSAVREAAAIAPASRATAATRAWAVARCPARRPRRAAPPLLRRCVKRLRHAPPPLRRAVPRPVRRAIPRRVGVADDEGAHPVMTRVARLTLGVALVVMFLSPARAAQGPKVFATPEDAAQALVEACERHDTAALTDILGPAATELINSGDPVQDKARLDRFVRRAKDGLHVEPDPFHVGRLVMNVGKDSWPAPVPIVKTAGGYRFDVDAAKSEILARRVGQERAQCHRRPA